MSVRVEPYDVRYARAVDRYVLAHPAGTPFHETRWLDLVRSSAGFENHTLVAWSEHEIRGVLPLALVALPVTGRRLVSVPYGVYGGILASDPDAVGALDEGVRLLAGNLHVRFVETRYLGAAATAPYESLRLYETYRRELPDDPADVLGSIPRKARAEVRKARERFGCHLVADLPLEDFYRLYCLNKRSLGSPLFRRGYFRRLLDLYGPRAMLHGVVRDGEVLGAVLSLGSGGVLYPYYSGATDEAGRLGINNAMYAFLMEQAVADGYRIFDFGRSRVGSGPAAFKRNMGFSPTPLDYQFHFPEGGSVPAINPDNPRMALPRRVLSRLPLWLARTVGPALMRHVP